MRFRHLPAILSLAALPFLIAAATPGAAPPSKSTPGQGAVQQARKAVASVAERYRTLKSYQLEGYSESRFSSSQGEQTSASSVRFKVSRPGKLSSEMRNEEMTSRVVSDGDSVWTSVAQLGQFTVQSLAQIRKDSDSLAFARQFDPAADYAHILDGVKDVRPLTRDTVHTSAGVVNCERYALSIAQPEGSDANLTMHPRVLWIDPQTRMVLLDSVRVDQKHPQLGEVSSVNVTRMVVAKPDPVFTASDFRFQADTGMKRVRRFLRRSPEHADMEGRPATDFTLESLASSSPVKLSALKGKVVVLDFWATWCGPCRRWMPIVAKAQRDYADRGVQVYAINLRESEAKVREYLGQQKIDVPVLMDRSGSVATDYRASSIPTTVIVGRDGKVVRVLVGLHGEEDLADVLHEAGVQ
jgi:thiol-disulfide isomerase/thioredoxin/outer membrane lipoprotein-sorting protein